MCILFYTFLFYFSTLYSTLLYYVSKAKTSLRKKKVSCLHKHQEVKISNGFE